MQDQMCDDAPMHACSGIGSVWSCMGRTWDTLMHTCPWQREKFRNERERGGGELNMTHYRALYCITLHGRLYICDESFGRLDLYLRTKLVTCFCNKHFSVFQLTFRPIGPRSYSWMWGSPEE